MDELKAKAAAPIPSVGAGGEQPIHKSTDHSIAEDLRENNSLGRAYEENLRLMRQMNDPAYLHTISMRELYENVYQSKPPVIDGLLYAGTYLFAGAPKVGKSFLVAQIAYHISTGTALWNYPVHKGKVLYLALEDDYQRLQRRLYRMFETADTENLRLAVYAKQLGAGLDEQLQKFVKSNPDTKLIIIDTLQKIRETVGEKYSYANDYEVITQFKKFADQNGICLLLVHHTRKQKADDTFDMISGTNGLLGAADGAFLLHKEKRTDSAAILDIVGRDQQDQRLYLSKDPVRLTWDLERTETELWKPPPDPVLETIAKIVTKDKSWSGTPTELVTALGVDLKPNTLTMRLNVNAGRLLNEYSIKYESSRTHDGRRVSFTLVPSQA